MWEGFVDASDIFNNKRTVWHLWWRTNLRKTQESPSENSGGGLLGWNNSSMWKVFGELLEAWHLSCSPMPQKQWEHQYPTLTFCSAPFGKAEEWLCYSFTSKASERPWPQKTNQSTNICMFFPIYFVVISDIKMIISSLLYLIRFSCYQSDLVLIKIVSYLRTIITACPIIKALRENSKETKG